SPTFWRLFLTSSALIVAAIGLLGFVIVGRVEQHSLEQIKETLTARAQLVRQVVRERPAAGLQERIADLGQEIRTRVTLIAADGSVLAESEETPVQMKTHGDRPEVQSARANRFGTATRQSVTLNKPMMYVALRADDPTSPVGFVRVAYPLDEVQGQ